MAVRRDRLPRPEPECECGGNLHDLCLSYDKLFDPGVARGKAEEATLISIQDAEDYGISLHEIAKQNCTTERTVWRHLKKLVAAGLVKSLDGTEWGEQSLGGREAKLYVVSRRFKSAPPVDDWNVDSVVEPKPTPVDKRRCSACLVTVPLPECDRHSKLHSYQVEWTVPEVMARTNEERFIRSVMNMWGRTRYREKMLSPDIRWSYYGSSRKWMATGTTPKNKGKWSR